MRIHRIYTNRELKPGGDILLERRSAHYLSGVLRVRAGQRVVLFNGDGHDYAADVEQAGKKEFALTVVSRLPAAPEPGLEITVVQAIGRGERMDQTLQKCTELGASAFQPLISERVGVRIKPEKLDGRVKHWQAVVVSACEQSGRAVVPPVHHPVTLGDWLEQGEGLLLALAPGAELPLARIDPGSHRRIAVVTGPEGGFSDDELARMKARECRLVGLGPRILRTETAAPAAVSILQSRFGDLA